MIYKRISLTFWWIVMTIEFFCMPVHDFTIELGHIIHKLANRQRIFIVSSEKWNNRKISTKNIIWNSLSEMNQAPSILFVSQIGKINLSRKLQSATVICICIAENVRARNFVRLVGSSSVAQSIWFELANRHGYHTYIPFLICLDPNLFCCNFSWAKNKILLQTKHTHEIVCKLCSYVCIFFGLVLLKQIEIPTNLLFVEL